MIAGCRGQHRQALALSERSLALRRSLGDRHLITTSANTFGLAAMRVGDLDLAEGAFEECLQLARELGEKPLTAAALCSLGEIALRRDLTTAAAERLVEAHTLYREFGDERDCAECLHALGGVAAAHKLPLEAARLWGAADALRERAGAALTPEEKAVDERFLSAVVAELGPDGLTRARSKGQSLKLAELDAIVSDLGSVAGNDLQTR
jgi:hypothetical protein